MDWRPKPKDTVSLNALFSFCILTGPGPPTQFRGQVTSEFSVLLSWRGPANANGIVRSYHIRTYETKTGREVNNIAIKKLTDPQSKMIANLKPFTNYTFTIQAATIEAGEMANFTAKTLQGGNGILMKKIKNLNTCPFFTL